MVDRTDGVRRVCGPRHRLVVVGRAAEPIIRYAGGWLVDQAMAGWNVYALLADPGDSRPLRILGTMAVDLDRITEALGGRGPQAVAVDASLYRSDELVRDHFRTVLAHGRADIRVWSDTRLAGVRSPVRHRLSAAARVFKAHALAAIGTPVDAVAGIEVFHSGPPLVALSAPVARLGAR